MADAPGTAPKASAMNRGAGVVTAPALLEVADLRNHFPTAFGVVKAVDGISYSVNQGETLAIVGESGSGKSVNALGIMGLVPPPGRVITGSISFNGVDLLKLDDGEMRKLRGNRIAMIFQDPLTSLNPVHSVGRQVAEVLHIHGETGRKGARERAVELLKTVGIHDAEERFRDYPHQFSGGMRQRVMIAMAIAMRPALIIADEPTTALDVTIQAQILTLLKSLQQEFGMSLILITHDLGMVAEHADKVAVMYAGHIVETSGVDDLYYNPLHPYALGLLGSIARLDHERKERLSPIHGQPPSLIRVPSGCPFHPRCAYARQQCIDEYPELLPRTHDSSHLAACHFAGELPAPHPPGLVPV
jgi:oligopeptide/dipeptide ABC transporter ATP-binding protein